MNDSESGHAILKAILQSATYWKIDSAYDFLRSHAIPEVS